MLALLCLSFFTLVLGHPTVVHLNYASYHGCSTSGISQWLGMRYAAAPVGDLRFEGPQDPPVVTGLQKATQVCSKMQNGSFIIFANILIPLSMAHFVSR